METLQKILPGSIVGRSSRWGHKIPGLTRIRLLKAMDMHDWWLIRQLTFGSHAMQTFPTGRSLTTHPRCSMQTQTEAPLMAPVA